MISISIKFTRAATGKPDWGFFWMMVLAIAILDDSARHEKEQRAKRSSAPAPAKPKPNGLPPRTAPRTVRSGRGADGRS